jgi:hypothetical protein
MTKKELQEIQRLIASDRMNEHKQKSGARMSIAEMSRLTLAGVYEVFKGRCHYGYNCGATCGPGTSTYGGSFSKNMRYWTDSLDYACWQHDHCLNDSKDSSLSRRRSCDSSLERTAGSIYNRNKRCSWWQVWCEENNYAANAWLVMKGMQFVRVFKIRK